MSRPKELIRAITAGPAPRDTFDAIIPTRAFYALDHDHLRDRFRRRGMPVRLDIRVRDTASGGILVRCMVCQAPIVAENWSRAANAAIDAGDEALSLECLNAAEALLAARDRLYRSPSLQPKTYGVVEPSAGQ